MTHGEALQETTLAVVLPDTVVTVGQAWSVC